MKILIDIQCLQSASRSRGIGKYVESFLYELTHRDLLNVTVVTNSSSILPIKSYHVDGHVELNTDGYDLRLDDSANFNPWQYASLQYTKFINNSNYDLYLIPSVFEGYIDTVVYPDFRACNTRIAVIHYDLIPLEIPEKYLVNRNYSNFYTDRLDSYSAFDLVFCISHAAQNSLLEYGIKTGEVSYIGSAVPKNIVNAQCSDVFLHTAEEELLKSKLEGNKFLLSVGVYEYRKNIEYLIECLPYLEDKEIFLVLVCHQSDAANEDIFLNYREILHRVILVPEISSSMLKWLYGNASLLLFPSRAEGFGLPLIEAIEEGLLPLASNIAVHREVLEDDTLLFELDDVHVLANVINKKISLSHEGDLRRLLKKVQIQYSWHGVVDRFLERLNNV